MIGEFAFCKMAGIEFDFLDTVGTKRPSGGGSASEHLEVEFALSCRPEA